MPQALPQPPEIDSSRFKDWLFKLWKWVAPTRKTWTPVLTFATPGNLAVTYSVQYGEYIRHGDLVTVHFRVATSAFTHTTASGNLHLTGLPFTAGTQSAFNWVGASTWTGITKANYTMVTPRVPTADNKILFNASGSGQANSVVGSADVPSGGTVDFNGFVIYRAA